MSLQYLMLKKFALVNGFITDGNIFIKNGIIIVEDGFIKKICKKDEIKDLNCEKIDVYGRLIIPGILNAHHHSYSSLACGLKTKDISTFPNRLKNLWWKLDKILDEELIYYSTLKSIVNAIKSGTTMIFDHHASMGYVKGSLNVLKEVYEKMNIKGILSLEVSERSKKNLKEQIEENINFYFGNLKNDRIKGIFGLHANFTLSDRTLEEISRIKPEEMGIHIHCGESLIDFDYCRKIGYSGPVDRLYKLNLLNEMSILAHCVHISNKDLRIINEIKPTIVSNPISNANNRVGCFDFENIRDYVLGTDGIGSDIINQLKFRFFQNSQNKNHSRVFFDNMIRTKEKFFPECGGLKEGKKADIVVLDYVPLTDVNKDNLISHIVFGNQNSNVYITVSDGRILFKDRKITFLDEERMNDELKSVMKKLEKKFYAIT